MNASELETIGGRVIVLSGGGTPYLTAPKLRTIGAIDNATQPIVSLSGASGLGVFLSTITKIYGSITATSWPSGTICLSVRTRLESISTSSSHSMPAASTFVSSC